MAEILTDSETVLLLLGHQELGHELGSNMIQVQNGRENRPNCSKLNVEGDSNFVDDDATIIMHIF